MTAPGGEGTPTRLEAQVDGNRIRVDGRATASGTGWSAVSNFTSFIHLAQSGGAITVTATEPSVDGEGEVESGSGKLAYKLSGRRLMVQALELGQDIDCELCVSAIDGRGQEQYTCIRLQQPGIEKRCRKCVPTDLRSETVLLATKTEAANAWPTAASSIPLAG